MSLEITIPKNKAHALVTARCNLDCWGCWWPNHGENAELNSYQWLSIMSYLKSRSVEGMVFSGGDPLVKQDLYLILLGAHLLGFRNTLSTNCLILKQKEHLLPYVHEVGIPLDGSTPETNGLFRIGNPNAFAAAINGLNLLSTDHPNIQLTVRTVVTKDNLYDIPKIGKIINPYRPRWKLYELTPIESAIGHQNLATTKEEFTVVANRCRDMYPNIQIDTQEANYQDNGYLLISQHGEMFTYDSELQKRSAGNILYTPWKEVDRRINRLFARP